jgi:formylglycine-generating enzyme
MRSKLLIFFLLLGCSSGLPENNTFLECAKMHVDVELSPQTIRNCPEEMTWVQGSFCTKVTQNCKEYLDPENSKFTRRCKEFEPSICIGDKVSMNFCMDTHEYSQDGNLPLSDVSWAEAKATCESLGKRLCSEPEWTFACEGEESFPYATGLTRPSSVCNMDKEKDVICGSDLCDRRRSVADNACLSPFHIQDMAGNVDEWIEVPMYHHSKVNKTMRSSLKGGHWLPVRNRCRPRTDDHDESYHQISIGFRCCKDL